MSWPGNHERSDPSEEETRITPPPRRESPRAGALRSELNEPPAGTNVGHLIALAVLEVSAAIDRLTHELREGRR